MLIPISIMLSAQMGAGWCGWRLGSRLSDRLRAWFMLGAVVVLITALAARDAWWPLFLFPVTELIFLGDWSAPCAALLAGLTLTAPHPTWWRRTVIAASLMLVVNIVTWSPLWRSLPPMSDTWEGVCCLQSTDSTCAPAAAATLLHLYGITSREDTLARDCLTTDHGTSRWGLWRGLRLATADSVYRVRASDGDLEMVMAHLPAIISVVLTKKQNEFDPRYAREWGWVIGQPHAVVLLGRGDRADTIRIADPKMGVEAWDESGVRALWNRQIFWLEKNQ